MPITQEGWMEAKLAWWVHMGGASIEPGAQSLRVQQCNMCTASQCCHG